MPGSFPEPEPAGTGLTRWRELRPSSWRNGGGTTREVLSCPAGTPDFDWRVSIADVAAPGAFSAFPGVDRVITLLEGASMVLDVAGAEHVLLPHQPFRFSGDAAVACDLPDGPTRDLNLMTRRGRARGEVVVRHVATGLPLEEPAGRRILVALTDGATASGRSGRAWRLDRYDVLDVPDPLTLGPGDFAVVELS